MIKALIYANYASKEWPPLITEISVNAVNARLIAIL